MELPVSVRIGLGAAALIALLIGEQVRPLREVTQPKWRRVIANLAFGAVGGIALAFVYPPVVIGVGEEAHRAGFGLLRWLHLPDAARALASFVLLDYTLWLWHLLNHRVPIVPGEVNSNFGTLLTAWDRLHGTFVHGIRQRGIVIGLAEVRNRLGVASSLAFPFTRGLRPRPFVRD